MAQRRPFISRKPTKDPTDYSDSTGDFVDTAKTHVKDRLNLASSTHEHEPLTDGELQILKDSAEYSKEVEKGKKAHKRFQDVKFLPANSVFDRHNPERQGSFHGFFALFWLGLAFLSVKTILQHWHQTGHFFSGRIMVMYQLNGWDLAFTDACMVASSVFVVFLQYLVYKGLSWGKIGWLIQQAWQVSYVSFIIRKSYMGDWQWIQSVVIILHCMVMLMKQHSYATYMGYLSEVWKARNKLQKQLVSMRDAKKKIPDVHVQPPSPLEEKSDNESSDSNHTLTDDADTNEDEEKRLLSLIEDLSDELTHDGVTYPQNLTLWNYIDYLLVPSLVYDIVFPRTHKIRWWYVFEKTLATLGTFGLMTLIVEHYILPVIPANLASMTTNQKLEQLPWLMLDMVFPFITMYLLTFYIIFECITNWFAEITCFADRNFYDDWWNSLNWDEFARSWNVPVHRFLLRHVYHSSMSVMNVKKQQATLITFFLSSLVHEMVMACMTKKIRVYLLCSQMLQLPLVIMMRTRLFKRNPAAANVFFWFGLFCGPSFLCLAYVLF